MHLLKSCCRKIRLTFFAVVVDHRYSRFAMDPTKAQPLTLSLLKLRVKAKSFYANANKAQIHPIATALISFAPLIA